MMDKNAGQRPFSVSGGCLNCGMSSHPVEHRHPMVDLVQRLSARLDSLAQVPLLSLPPQDQRELLVDLAKCRTQLDNLHLRMLAQAEHSEATTDSGAASAADWVAIETRQVRRDARSDLKLAQRLEQHPCLSAAMGEGRVNTAQARAITAALDRLPRAGEFAVSAEQRVVAEQHLVELAGHHDAKALRFLGQHLFEVIAPELAEKFEGKLLEHEEARALQRTTLTMWEDDEGTTHGRFRIPTMHGQMLTKMILALTSPARAAGATGAAATGIDPDLPTPVRHGIALTQLIESYPAEALPKTGGRSATVVVTMTLEQLLADLDAAGVCALDT